MSIILDHINYCYSADSAYKVQALKDVSLEINDGEFIGIIGHTGSGKSTLIQHMNGLLKATSGHIYYNGQDIYDNDYDLSKLRHKVGMVFQYPEHQLFETTNFEDVCFGPKNQGLDRKTVELRAYEALQNVHFPEDLYYQPPFDLSGGQKRRVAIAGVLAMHPDVLILDEPTAGLDPAGRDEILGLLLQMKKDLGITIILVSHSMEDVAEYVDRIIVMNSGEVMFDGVPKEVFSLPAVTDSIPEPEPVYSTVTVTPGFFSMNDSLSASQSFSIEVLPASESEPLKFSFDVPSSALVSALLSAPSELEPHPVNAAVIIVAAVAKTKSFFIRFFILISSFISFLN